MSIGWKKSVPCIFADMWHRAEKSWMAKPTLSNNVICAGSRRPFASPFSSASTDQPLCFDSTGRGYRTKVRLYRDGRQIGGGAFRTGALSQLLKNPIDTGKVGHKDKIYDGEHEAILYQVLDDEVQRIFAANRSENALGKKSNNPSLLAGLIADPDGIRITFQSGAFVLTARVERATEWRRKARLHNR